LYFLHYSFFVNFRFAPLLKENNDDCTTLFDAGIKTFATINQATI